MRRAVLSYCLALSFAAASGAEAGPKHETILFDFTDSKKQGASPADAPLIDAAGTFYGANQFDGSANMGTAWAVGADGKLTVLHQFQGAPSDGNFPMGKLALGPDGALYGATYDGGAFDKGTVYRLAQTGGVWNLTVLYSFCHHNNPCADGANPWGSLAIAEDGTIFGTTASGGDGVETGAGTLFRLDPPSGGGSWKYRVIYNFCSQDQCSDGELPTPGPLLTKQGKIYGTVAAANGTSTGGIYSINTDGRHYQLLHTFLFRTGSDGYRPRNGVARDSHGVLYGTTQFDNGPNCGTVYSFDPQSSAFQTLYTFCSHPNDVNEPFNVPALVESSGGITIYGAAEGGTYGEGGLYRLRSPTTPGGAWKEKVVYSFCALSGCPDGRVDDNGTVVHRHGAIYGTTANGGATGGGLLYRWSAEP